MSTIDPTVTNAAPASAATPKPRRWPWKRSAPDPVAETHNRIARIEKDNIDAVKWDHRFSTLAIVVIALAAMVGMSAKDIQDLIAGKISGLGISEIAIAFVAVLVSNRALKAASREIRRSTSRGEAVASEDQRTMYGTMIMESISFGYMLYLFENPQSFIQWVLLAARAGVLPYATVYLEQRREQAIDPTDISVQTEIASGLGMMRDFILNAYDHTVPTALKVMNYRASARLTDVQDNRLQNMQAASEAVAHFGKTGEIKPVELVDVYGAPLRLKQTTPPPAASVRTPAAGKLKAKTPAKPAENSGITADQLAEIEAMVNRNHNVSVRTVASALGVATSTVFPHLKGIKEKVKANKKNASPVRTGKGKKPPTPDESITQEPPPAPAVETV